MCPSIADFAVASLTAAGFGWWSWTVGAVGFPRRHDEFALGLCALPFAVRGVVLRVADSWVQHGDMLELNPVCAPFPLLFTHSLRLQCRECSQVLCFMITRMCEAGLRSNI
jgi:hypothetical protein